MGRIMQWNTNNMFKLSILLSFTLFLFLLPAPVHGTSLELLHRHHDRFTGGELDRVEAFKGFVQRDSVRRLQINQRLGISADYDNRRKATETEPSEVEMPLLTGRDMGIGEYFVEVKVGSPGQRVWLAADTGSEFTWFNAVMKQKNETPHKRHKKKRARRAKKHHHKGSKKHSKKKSKSHKKSDPCNGVFCPHKSQSFKSVTCSSRKCKVDLSELFSLTSCPNPSDPCLYDISYADGSSARGFFGTDSITLNRVNGKHEKLHNVTVGCTTEMLDGVNFNEETGGILGLGYAKDSFIDKAGGKYGSQFSYCLVDHLSHRDVSSYLTLGGYHRAKLMAEMKKTDLVLFPPFYGVNVVGISIGNEMLKIPSHIWDFNGQGGAIVDSGTTLTALLTPAYEPVFEALTKPLAKVKQVIAQEFGSLDFCFENEGFDEIVMPRLAFHFSGGARFEPPVKSYIIDVAPQVKCLGIVQVMGENGVSVIGNIMQQDHLWEFDFAKNTVGFAPSICT
ncbi:hypothetical protein PHAVU_005G045500 [Phaseolus vulgaris]|uniref:Peptidase A1 domain-containing protein n=1 Tax=Phaseolus vulgaris TaxID=3885 RepID=V7BVU2_PHAVU|nr:hypothetical protein PHAVU_005G045500g [Phaseolus vulgaris]ESW21143.1 hypothetical protein PHAVU_005G045500g [Phaseolus vulgaris]